MGPRSPPKGVEIINSVFALALAVLDSEGSTLKHYVKTNECRSILPAATT